MKYVLLNKNRKRKEGQQSKAKPILINNILIRVHFITFSFSYNIGETQKCRHLKTLLKVKTHCSRQCHFMEEKKKSFSYKKTKTKIPFNNYTIKLSFVFQYRLPQLSVTMPTGIATNQSHNTPWGNKFFLCHYQLFIRFYLETYNQH